MQYIITIGLGLVSTILGVCVTHLYSKLKQMGEAQKELETSKVEELIDEKVADRTAEIHKEFEDSKAEVLAELKKAKEQLKTANVKFETIKDSYRYRLIALCQIYLDKGEISCREYNQVSEMWKVYSGLGGNSQGEDYYHLVEKLFLRS